VENMRRMLTVVAAFGLLSNAPALAADMAVKAVVDPVATTTPSWTGFYLGGNAGVMLV
jgi:hypothetical protein